MLYRHLISTDLLKVPVQNVEISAASRQGGSQLVHRNRYWSQLYIWKVVESKILF